MKRRRHHLRDFAVRRVLILRRSCCRSEGSAGRRRRLRNAPRRRLRCLARLRGQVRRRASGARAPRRRDELGVREDIVRRCALLVQLRGAPRPSLLNASALGIRGDGPLDVLPHKRVHVRRERLAGRLLLLADLVLHQALRPRQPPGLGLRATFTSQRRPLGALVHGDCHLARCKRPP